MEPTILLFSTISILVTFLLIQKLLKKPSAKLRLPPGPPKLPVIGNLHQLAAKKTPLHRCLRELAGVYGPIMHLRLGGVSTVVVSSAELAKEVLKTHDVNFANRPKLMVGKILYNNYSDIGLAPYGEYWRQLRKIATLELFTVKRVQSFRHVREDEVSKFIKSLALEASSASVFTSTCAVNLSDKIFKLMFNITSRIVFSRKGEDEEAFKTFSKDLITILAGLSLADLYPSSKLLNSMSGLRRKLEQMVKESDKIVNPIIHEHILKKKQGGTEDEDLVDVLLNYQNQSDVHTHTNTSFSLTIMHIKSVVLEIFSAGSETSSTTIEWAMSELLKSPKAMERAQAEIREVYQKTGFINESSLTELKYLKFVIKETLRLHPPAPLLVPRESIEHCQIHGYDIPPKTRIFVNVLAVGTDPKHWPDPDMFKPERFEESSVDFKGTNYEFIPFGAGRRMCPGVALGAANVELPLAMLLCHFDWKLPAGTTPQDLDMDEYFGLTVSRMNKLYAIPVTCALATI